MSETGNQNVTELQVCWWFSIGSEGTEALLPERFMVQGDFPKRPGVVMPAPDLHVMPPEA